MKKKVIIAAIVVFFVVVLMVLMYFFSHYGEKENISEKVQQREGVYYDALDIKEIGFKYDGNALYSYDSLFYNNKIYTSNVLNYKQYSLEEFEVFSTKIISLGKVYENNGVYASVDSSALYEVTGTGTLFQLREYDEDYRIGIYRHYKRDNEAGNDEHYTVQIYDCLNDIWVKQGKEIYQTMFHLEDAERIDLVAGYDGEGEKKVIKQVDFWDDVFPDFFEAMCNGNLLTLQEREEEGASWRGENMSDSSFLLFTDRYGIQTEVYVYKEGYVLYQSPENTEFVVRVDGEMCGEVLKMFQ